MLDLLVSIAGKSRLNPSGLALQLISEETGKPIAYKPNQTIGALEGREVILVRKTDSLSKDKYRPSSKKKQPFEMTHRFTINLPRGQKTVSRVSPITTMGELMNTVCKEKCIDPQRHAFQIPGQPEMDIDPGVTVGQLGTFELNLVDLAMRDRRLQAFSMPDLSQVPGSGDRFPSYMPSSGETKKKKGFFSFFSKKDKKFKPNDTYYDMETSSTASHMMTAAQSRKVAYPQNVRRGSDTGLEQGRPKSMFVPPNPGVNEHSKISSKENIQSQIAAPARKKRKAPAPPVPTAAAANKTDKESAAAPDKNIESHIDKVPDSKLHKEATSNVNKVSSSNQKDVNSSALTSQSSSRADLLSRLHSRNSSDSSGYHELTLSGCESPEASHGVIKSKISIDSTSIESTDNANGDSGIHESPIRVSPIEEVLEKNDTSLVAGAPSTPEKGAAAISAKKKKKAPAPPPVPTSPPLDSSEKPIPEVTETPISDIHPEVTETPISDIHVQNTEHEPKVSTEHEETSTHTPENTMEMKENDDIPCENIETVEDTGFDFNEILNGINLEEEPASTRLRTFANVTEANEDPMMMMETASVSSENIEQIDVVSKSERPCAFIPPPPPTEPPPPDEPEVDIESLGGPGKPVFVDKGTGVNEDNTSLAPSSVKNSPDMAQHRRLDSFSSVGSVDTIEGISLDFQMAIKMGQETLSPSLDDVEVPTDGFKSEMALFVERMSKMAVDNSQVESNHLNDSLSSGLSVPGSESNSDTGSVIRHLRNDSHDSKSGSETGSVRNKQTKHAVESESGFLPPLQQREEIPADIAVSEEISVPVETVPPPPEFDDAGEDQFEESEEEIIETVEEIIIPRGPDGYDFSSAQKVSEISNIVTKEIKKDDKTSGSGGLKAESVTVTPYQTTTQSQQKSSYHTKPAEKEEFVLTTEDLSNVTFLPPKQKPDPKPFKMEESNVKIPSTTLIMSKSSPRPDDKGNRNDFSSLDIQNRVSRLSFTPRPESETDSMLEEKPITLLNLPPVMNVPKSNSSFNGLETDDHNDAYLDEPITSETVNDFQVSNHAGRDLHSNKDYNESAVYISQTTPAATENVEERPGSRASATSFDLTDQQEGLQAQYNDLQKQFAQWQEQLQHNQSLLSPDNPPGEFQSQHLQQLASQMAMQQEMMTQLQMSMQALQQQQQQVPPPPPPPPVIVPEVNKPEVKLKPVKAAKPKMDPRFERKLDPREELMIAIRSFNGREGLRSVPVKDTKWVHSNR